MDVRSTAKDDFFFDRRPLLNLWPASVYGRNDVIITVMVTVMVTVLLVSAVVIVIVVVVK